MAQGTAGKLSKTSGQSKYGFETGTSRIQNSTVKRDVEIARVKSCTVIVNAKQSPGIYYMSFVRTGCSITFRVNYERILKITS